MSRCLQSTRAAFVVLEELASSRSVGYLTLVRNREETRARTMADDAVPPHLPLIDGEDACRRHQRHLPVAGGKPTRSLVGRLFAGGRRDAAWASRRVGLPDRDRHRHLGPEPTVGWGFDITNFVFWIGIGHAGTLISACCSCFRQRWRTAVNRSAEAMTIFAVMCAGLFPLIHMGRPWLAYWVFPYPNTAARCGSTSARRCVGRVRDLDLLPDLASAFWYVGMIPDLATMRDRATVAAQAAALRLVQPGLERLDPHLACATRRSTCMLLAGLATPLVFSVHTIVSFDFATSIIPGWHTTIFPPYFVAGAIFSGLAMVLTLMLVARKVMRLENYITVGPRRRDVQADHRHGRHRRHWPTPPSSSSPGTPATSTSSSCS